MAILGRAFILTILLGLTAKAEGQESGTISGLVTDEQGRPFVKAMVTLTEVPDVGVLTDSLGNFQIEDLEPGLYTIVVRAIGIELELSRVELAAANTATVRMTVSPSYHPFIPGIAIPERDVILDGYQLLPVALQDSLTLEFFAGSTLNAGTTLVWAPWWPDQD